MNAQPFDADVVIAGYGPVGAILGNLLGQAGHRVVVVERQPSVYHLPRAAHFDHEIMRVFQAVGLDQAVGSATCGIDGMHLVNGAGDILLAFDQPVGPAPVAEANDYMFHQPGLELALRSGIERFRNVEVLLEHEVVGLEDHAIVLDEHGGVDVMIDNVHTGVRTNLRARYLVGADGARSAVRSAAGLSLTDFGFDESWLVIDLLMKRSVSLPTVCQQICDPRRPATFVPMPDPRRRFEFMVLPGEDPDDLRDEQEVYELLSPWLTPDDAEIERAVVYTFQAGVSPAWRAGSVLLAGDSAHLMPPFLGQGMCSGIRDAANLAWKLDLVLHGLCEARLLDSYASERSAHVQAIIELAVAIGRTICLLDPEAAAERDAQMLGVSPASKRDPDSGSLLPPLGPGCHEGVTAGAGRLFIQPWVQRWVDGARVRLDDVLGAGFALITVGPDPRPRHGTIEGERWERLGGMAVMVRTSASNDLNADGVGYDQRVGKMAEVIDVDGFLEAWFARHHLDTVLLRPDRYVLSGRSSADGSEGGGGSVLVALTLLDMIDSVDKPGHTDTTDH